MAVRIAIFFPTGVDGKASGSTTFSDSPISGPTGKAFVDEVTGVLLWAPPIDVSGANHANERCALLFSQTPKAYFCNSQPASISRAKFRAFFVPYNFHGLGKVVFQAAVIVPDEVVEASPSFSQEAAGLRCGRRRVAVSILNNRACISFGRCFLSYYTLISGEGRKDT